MEKKKPELDSLLRGNKFCVKCGSSIKYDEVGHKCELIPCPQNKSKAK